MARKSKAGRKPRHSGEVLRKNRTFRIRGRLDQLLEKSACEKRAFYFRGNRAQARNQLS